MSMTNEELLHQLIEFREDMEFLRAKAQELFEPSSVDARFAEAVLAGKIADGDKVDVSADDQGLTLNGEAAGNRDAASIVASAASLSGNPAIPAPCTIVATELEFNFLARSQQRLRFPLGLHLADEIQKIRLLRHINGLRLVNRRLLHRHNLPFSELFKSFP